MIASYTYSRVMEYSIQLAMVMHADQDDVDAKFVIALRSYKQNYH